MERSRLEQTLEYVERGFALLPLAPRSKEPYAPLLRQDSKGKRSWKGFALYPPTAVEVESWFQKVPELNVGIITGEPSGNLVVVDYDTRSFTKTHLPPTCTVTTSKGYHYYYRSEAPLKSGKFDHGDIKATGGYVVAPPSFHPSGSTYTWTDRLSLMDLDVASIPSSFINDGLVPSKTSGSRKSVNESSLTRKGVATKNIIGCYTEKAETQGKVYMLAATQSEVAISVLQQVGIGAAEIGRPFLCPFAGHDSKNGRPSAALHRTDNGLLMLHCFHDNSSWHVVDIYAMRVTGVEEPLTKAGRVVWSLRALAAIGAIAPPDMESLPLPENAPEAAQRLYSGFHELCRLQALYNPHQEGAPFSWRFAQHWCGIGSQSTVSKGMDWLFRSHYLKKVGERKAGDAAVLSFDRPRAR